MARMVVDCTDCRGSSPVSLLAMDMGKMSGKNIDDEIEWWRRASVEQPHPEIQMVCLGVATGLKMAKADFDAGRPQPKLRTLPR